MTTQELIEKFISKAVADDDTPMPKRKGFSRGDKLRSLIKRRDPDNLEKPGLRSRLKDVGPPSDDKPAMSRLPARRGMRGRRPMGRMSPRALAPESPLEKYTTLPVKFDA